MTGLFADLRSAASVAAKEFQVMRRYPGTWGQMTFWPVALPIVYVLQAEAFSGGNAQALDAFAARTGTYKLAGFLFIGWSVYMWLSIVLWGPGTALRQQQVQGQLEAVFLTPVARSAVLFGPMAAYLVVTLFMFGVAGLALRLGFHTDLGLAEVLRALAVVVVSIPALYGLGALFSAAVLRFREVNGLVQVVRGAFTVFCGMTYPIVILPAWARDVAYTLPPTYVISDFREVLLRGSRLVSLLPDFAILLASGSVLCVLASLTFRATERHARRGGALVQY